MVRRNVDGALQKIRAPRQLATVLAVELSYRAERLPMPNQKRQIKNPVEHHEDVATGPEQRRGRVTESRNKTD
jgi:hypothetical protein